MLPEANTFDDQMGVNTLPKHKDLKHIELLGYTCGHKEIEVELRQPPAATVMTGVVADDFTRSPIRRSCDRVTTVERNPPRLSGLITPGPRSPGCP